MRTRKSRWNGLGLLLSSTSSAPTIALAGLRISCDTMLTKAWRLRIASRATLKLAFATALDAYKSRTWRLEAQSKREKRPAMPKMSATTAARGGARARARGKK